jgi:glycerol 2-dehydrogenase (NADP+)
LIENFTIVELSKEEIDELHSIDKQHHFRACHPNWTGFGSLGFPDCK